MQTDAAFETSLDAKANGITGFHPLALTFPPLSTLEYEALKADVEANGLREPIAIDRDGLVLDGVHRYRLCLETSTPLSVRQVVEYEPAAFILSRNLTRRSLSQAQRAMVGVTLYYSTVEALAEVTLEEVAQRLGVGLSTLKRAKRVYDYDREEGDEAGLPGRPLTPPVCGGELSLKQAEQEIVAAEEAARRACVGRQSAEAVPRQAQDLEQDSEPPGPGVMSFGDLLGSGNSAGEAPAQTDDQPSAAQDPPAPWDVDFPVEPYPMPRRRFRDDSSEAGEPPVESPDSEGVHGMRFIEWDGLAARLGVSREIRIETKGLPHQDAMRVILHVLCEGLNEQEVQLLLNKAKAQAPDVALSWARRLLL